LRSSVDSIWRACCRFCSGSAMLMVSSSRWGRVFQISLKGKLIIRLLHTGCQFFTQTCSQCCQLIINVHIIHIITLILCSSLQHKWPFLVLLLLINLLISAATTSMLSWLVNACINIECQAYTIILEGTITLVLLSSQITRNTEI